MTRKDKQLTPCERVVNWSLEYADQALPSSLQEHIDQCLECQAFLKEEAWIRQTIQEQAELAPTTLSSDKFARVYEAIQETSERLTAPVKQSIPWWQVITATITTCAVLLAGFWWLPLFNGETFLANRMNTQFRSILQYQAPITEIASVSGLDSSLQFASRYYQSNEEKGFYYANDHYSYEELLWMKWLVQKTCAKYEEIAYDYKSLTPARLLKKWHISPKDAMSGLQEVIKGYHQTRNLADLQVEGLVERIDYFTKEIWLDSYPHSFKISEDSEFLKLIKMNACITLSLQKQNESWLIVDMKESSMQTTILRGVLSRIESDNVYLEDNPATIQITNKTQTGEENLESLLSQSVQIRVMTYSDRLIALTLKKQATPNIRTITGLIEDAYQYGFTLQSLQQSFLLSDAVTMNPLQISKTIQISLTGEDYGSYFLVRELTLILPPEPKEEILLASASPATQTNLVPPTDSAPKRDVYKRTAPPEVKPVQKAETDWIVGLKNNLYLLASGISFPKGNLTIPIGSKISYTKQTGTFSVQSHQINNLSISRFQAVIHAQLGNGVTVLLNGQNKRVMVLNDQSLPGKNQTVQVQGRCIEYPELVIMLEGRIFQTHTLQSLNGLIVREMERGKVFLMEDGTIFHLDAFSEVKNGPLSVGKTVKIIGKSEHSTFTAFIVEVQKEFAIFQGKITEINREEKWCRIDSGKQFYWTNEAQYNQLLQAMKSGRIVYCKAYYENQQWIIENVIFFQGESGDQA